ncbi:MAG: hypothetical protein ABIH83_05525 [Candidatus Micrarchaeota archaeon]
MAEMKKFEQLKHDVIRDGGFFVYFYFDMHAGNKEALQNIMVGFVSKITKEAGVRMAVAEIDEPIKREELFSTTAKVSMLVSGFSDLMRLTMTYTPIGIEVEEPLDAKIDAGEMQNALMGISATSQQLTYHILTKTMNEEQKKSFEKKMAAKGELGKKLRDRIKESNGEEKSG